MNLHNIVSGCIGSVNPPVTCSYQQSLGSTIDTDGSRLPTFAAPVQMTAQKQPMTWQDTRQVDGLNINGEKAAFYVSGDWQALIRSTSRGGDLLTLADGSVWLVVMPLEDWFSTAGWAKVACVLQNGA